jgi:hypothetical protein
MVNAINDQIAADIESAAQAELNWLFRQVQLKIRRINQYRPKVSVQRPKLSKAYFVSNDLWGAFKERMHEALTREILAGAIKIFDINKLFLGAEKGITFNSNEFAEAIRQELGQRITLTETAIKRQVGRKIVSWYNSPGTTMQSVVDQLKGNFGVERAHRIAQNEITYLNSRVQENIAKQVGITEWWWNSKRDQLVCQKPLKGPDGNIYKGCRELHGKKFKIGQPMPPDGSHIACRCNGVLVVPKPQINALERLLGASFSSEPPENLKKFDPNKHPRKEDGKFAFKERMNE